METVEAAVEGKRMKRWANKDGSASVFLLCLMAAVIPVFLMLYEHASYRTLEHAVEWNGENAGRAVLSYYLPQLSEAYDIYGVWNDETILRSRMERYIEANSPFWNGEEGTGLLKARLEELEIDGSEYSLMDTEQWKKQIRTVMELGTYIELLERTELFETLKEVTSLMGEGLDGKEAAGRSQVQRSGQGTVSEEAETEEDSLKEKMEQLLRDKERREEMGQKTVESIGLIEGRVLDDFDMIEALPSRQIDTAYRQKPWDVFRLNLGQMGTVIQDSLYTDLYAVRYFGNFRDQRDGWFACELEYILHGKLSDETNFKRTKQDLFLMRTALNLAAIYRDETMTQMIGAMALAMAPVPYPAAFGIIAASLSAAEAGNDVKALLQGESVPVLKQPDQWTLAELATDESAASAEEEGELWTMSYEDHLHVLLLLHSQETKLIRMMDLVQLNASKDLGKEFSLKECSAGFRWKIRAQLETSTGQHRMYEGEGVSSFE